MRDSRPSYVRVLARVIAIVGRRAPVTFGVLVAVDLVLMGANVLGFHLLEGVISRLSDTQHLDEIVAAIVVVGIVLVIPELLEMVADPIATLFWGRSIGALTEMMSEKVKRLEVIDFETLDANERLQLAASGKYGAVSMLLSFLFPMFQLVFFALAGIYLYTLSPLLALVIPFTFAPRIAIHLVRGSRYYRLERKTVPTLREYQYLEQCVVDREYFKETRVLGAGAHLLQRYRGAIRRFKHASMARGSASRKDRSGAERSRRTRLRRRVCAGGVSVGLGQHRRWRVRGGDLRGEQVHADDRGRNGDVR
ncbi:MAG: hypothetical protein OXP69_00410 [Spirochaetaceae bacterium]|nr:hypothetical protein [Spirochaetaceae bacterium]